MAMRMPFSGLQKLTIVADPVEAENLTETDKANSEENAILIPSTDTVKESQLHDSELLV